MIQLISFFSLNIPMRIKLSSNSCIKQVICPTILIRSFILHLLDQPLDSTITLKLASDIGRGMAFLHGITSSFRPSFILNSHHIMVNSVTDEFRIRSSLSIEQVQTYCMYSIDGQVYSLASSPSPSERCSCEMRKDIFFSSLG